MIEQSQQNTLDYDYEGYVKSLEIVYNGVSRDYWASLLDINHHQLSVSRTYLWVSVALIGLYAAIIDGYQDWVLSQDYLVALFSMAYVTAISAFGICLYAIPARRGYRAIPEKGWGEFSNSAYGHLENKSDRVYATFLAEHISKIDHAYAHNIKTNKQRAKLLRITFLLLITSFVFTVSITVLALLTTINHTSEEIIMSEENNTLAPSQQNSAPTSDKRGPELKLNVPKPPPPADIGGSDISITSDSPGHKPVAGAAIKPKE